MVKPGFEVGISHLEVKLRDAKFMVLSYDLFISDLLYVSSSNSIAKVILLLFLR